MFPQYHKPRIYAYTDERFGGQIKVGYTNKTAEERVREQMESVKLPRKTWEIILDELAIRDDGSFFSDHEIHRRLKKKGIRNTNGEWFECSIDEIKSCILAEKKGIKNEENRSADFPMRPEQLEAVEKTAQFFHENSYKKQGVAPHFLWNAKMRFGKTFAAYQLAKKMEWKKVLVLTFKPAVQSAWREDLLSHIDFEGWQFASNKEEDLSYNDLDKDKPFVFFASFQDILGIDKKTGGIKPKNEWVHQEEWDCVVFDEYHYGAWRDSNKNLFSDTDAQTENEKYLKTEAEKEIKEGGKGKVKADEKEDGVDILEARLPIKTQHYLYLTGTPFRAIETGEFLEDAIFSWTYTDEQKAKRDWDIKQGKNPYEALPRMVMLTYQLPEEVQRVAEQGEFNEFDLNEFFKAEGEGENAEFIHKEEVQKWLSIIRGKHNISENLKQSKNEKPVLPFENMRLLSALQHTFWYLPNVASCYAMANLLAEPQNTFYHDYQVIICAGNEAGVGETAYHYLKNKMGEPLKTKSITLSCGKLTTGVSVPPWSGILMLRNIMSPETYFQTIFRVQTPWVIKNWDKTSPNQEEIIKQECYVFDFAPNRALKQVASYAEKLGVDSEKSAPEKIADLISFLPILAYDGNAMLPINAEGVLDYAIGGATGSLLAKRWNSATLVNVDNNTLAKVLNDDELMAILEKIEGFRNVKDDVQSIVASTEKIKDLEKQKAETEDENTQKELKKEIDQEEKERQNKRGKIREKLMQFATRIPIFMYLSEYREQTLKDVITQLEPELFTKVTGLTQEDFGKLEKIGLFNGAKMDMAVFGFKRYEDKSLEYTGIYRYEDEKMVGGYNTIISKDEYGKI